MDIYLVSGIWLWAVLSVQATGKDCSGTPEVMAESEMCVSEINDYKDKAMRGKLTYLSKDTMCSVYTEAVQCLDLLLEECQSGNYPDEAQAQMIKNDLTSGFGKFCDKDKYFDTYTTHANCYERVTDQTGDCLQQFNKDLDIEIVEAEFNHDETPMCRAKENLERCVVNAVKPTCGQEATDMFVDIFSHHIPTSMVGHCDPDPDIKSTPTSMAGIIPGHSVLVVYMCTVVAVLIHSVM